jgi:uracil-DNA glycosylase
MASSSPAAFARLLKDVRACAVCAAHLPLGPRPVVRMAPGARLLIVGQAPGTKVHETGIPWNDRSGDQLRSWLGLDRDVFYDETRIAIMPMGFCYPGRDARGGDAPPRPCSDWHAPVLDAMPGLELIVLVGAFAQRRYLETDRPLTETVRNWRDAPTPYLRVPHPSPRNLAWFKANPWFEAEVVPELRARTRALLS